MLAYFVEPAATGVGVGSSSDVTAHDDSGDRAIVTASPASAVLYRLIARCEAQALTALPANSPTEWPTPPRSSPHRHARRLTAALFA